jgi:hypothetical protein
MGGHAYARWRMTSWLLSPATAGPSVRRAPPGAWSRPPRIWSITSCRRCRCGSGSSRCPSGCAISCTTMRRCKAWSCASCCAPSSAACASIVPAAAPRPGWARWCSSTASVRRSSRGVRGVGRREDPIEDAAMEVEVCVSAGGAAATASHSSAARAGAQRGGRVGYANASRSLKCNWQLQCTTPASILTADNRARRLQDCLHPPTCKTPLWNLNLDDGVAKTMAPLRRLVPQYNPWQQVLKAKWDELCARKYDWVHLSTAVTPAITYAPPSPARSPRDPPRTPASRARSFPRTSPRCGRRVRAVRQGPR